MTSESYRHESAVLGTGSALVDSSPSTSHWSKTIPLLVFVLALFVRLGYWSDSTLDTTHGFNEFHWLAGAPISDANTWVDFGDVIKRGCARGHDWVARRPLYGYFLASIYTWTDARLSAAQWANVIMSSLSVMFIYCIAGRLFGIAAGLGTALWFCFEPHSLQLSVVPLTETIGCFFTVWHLWLLMRATDGKQSHYVAAGFAFAAANLTRTLSLFALPTEVLLVWLISARHRRSIWSGFKSAFIFGASVSLLLILGMARNYWIVGIFTISDNTSSILYAATSPDYGGAWTSEVELEARKLGINSNKDRYDFYMNKAKENLKKDPMPYVRRVEKMWWEVIAVSLDSPWFHWFPLLFSGTLIASALGVVGNQNYSRVSISQKLLFLVVIALLVIGIYWSNDIRGRWLIWSMAILALTRSLLKLDQGLYVANLWFWSVVGVAAFGVFSDRFMLMFDWLLAIGAFGGISIVSRLIARGLMGRFPVPSFIPIDHGFARIAHTGLIAMTVILMVSGFFGISAECTNYPIVNEVKIPSAKQAVETTLKSIPSAPEVIKDDLRGAMQRLSNSNADNAAVPGLLNDLLEREQRKTGHLWVANGRLIGGPYRISAHVLYECDFEVARTRPYGRTILEVTGIDSAKNHCKGWVTFDGNLPDDVVATRFLIVGVYDHYNVSGFLDLYEALAIFPLDENDVPILERGQFAHTPEHLDRVKKLIPDPSANIQKAPK